MDILDHGENQSKKRVVRKRTSSNKGVTADTDIPESFSASPNDTELACEYTNSQANNIIEEWTPTEITNEKVQKPKRVSKKSLQKNTEIMQDSEESTPTIPEEVKKTCTRTSCRRNRFKTKSPSNLTPTELNPTQLSDSLYDIQTNNDQPENVINSNRIENNNLKYYNAQYCDIYQPTSNINDNGQDKQIIRTNTYDTNNNYNNNRNNSRDNRNQQMYQSQNLRNNNNKQNSQQIQNNRNQRRRPATTIRIGQFSIGYLRGMEIFDHSNKLFSFADSIIDYTQEPIDLNYLLNKSNDDLTDFANSIELEDTGSRGKILDTYMKSAIESRQPIIVSGILESMEGGDGIITYSCDQYKIRAKSTFVPRCLIQALGLRKGQNITAYVHPPMEQSTCPFAIKILEVCGRDPSEASKFPRFKDMTPYFPTERIFLENQEFSASDNLSLRIVDLLSPVGFGQRGLIVAAPKTGKTILLQAIANAIIKNQNKAKLIVLLIDERPEEVTDFARQVPGAEIMSSTFDESAENHVHVAEIAIENARRRVEAGEHVIILLDSITRLARAYNAEQPSSGRVMSGGVEAGALQAPKRFFGSARNIECGGSLTILATALIETGSKMDDVIFEEFKGTGNMELHLDRTMSERRIFPAINIDKSGTRKEELLYHPEELNKIYNLRKALQGVQQTEAIEMLINRLKQTQSNVEFLKNINR